VRPHSRETTNGRPTGEVERPSGPIASGSLRSIECEDYWRKIEISRSSSRYIQTTVTRMP